VLELHLECYLVDLPYVKTDEDTCIDQAAWCGLKQSTKEFLALFENIDVSSIAGLTRTLQFLKIDGNANDNYFELYQKICDAVCAHKDYMGLGIVEGLHRLQAVKIGLQCSNQRKLMPDIVCHQLLHFF